MIRGVTETENRAFWGICLFAANNPEYPVSSRLVKERIGCSLYAARKATARLRDMGLLKRGSLGIPAFEGSGEYKDDWYDAPPPVNGYLLTEKGRSSSEMRIAETVVERRFAEWASDEE